MDILGIRLSKLRAHPLLLHAELGPEPEEDEDENEEPSHLGDGDRDSEESSQNASVDGVAHDGVRTGGDQLVILLNCDGAAPIAAEVLTRPDGEEKAADGEGSSHPEGPESSAPERPVKPGQRDPGCREEDDRDQHG